MKRYSPIFAIWFALSNSTAVWSQDETMTQSTVSCTLPDNLPPQPTRAMWRAVRPELAKKLDFCLKNSDFFALYGASLLYTGEVAKGLEMLERSLLLNPDNGSARIDYAQALYQSGQLLAAIQVNQELLSKSDVPSPIRAFLKERHTIWSERLTYSRNQISYLYGFSNNLNNATHINELDFTLSGQRFPVVISADNLAQSGQYHFANLSSQYYRLHSDGASMLNFALKTRQSDLTRSDTDEFKVSYEKEHEGLSQRNSWSFGIEHLRLGDTGLYSAFEGVWRIMPKIYPSPYLDLETRYVDFNGQDLLDEVSFMIRPGIAIATSEQRYGIEIGLGSNQAVDDRPGGNRTQAEASLFYDMALLGGRLASRISYSETLDKEGYSPILESNARRETEALTTALQYFYPINEDWVIHSSYYYRSQESNISLFSTQTKAVETGFTYRF